MVNMKKARRIILYVVMAVMVGWSILTLLVEKRGAKKSWDFKGTTSNEKVLIIYDPDPFYNLDEQVCLSIAQALTDEGLNVKVATVSAAKAIDSKSYNAFVFCANTYNWTPDWAVSNYITKQNNLNYKPVLALTLGAGSTGNSQKKLEQLITTHNGKLINSHSIWLMRPNDEQRMGEPNVQVALSRAKAWSNCIVQELRHP